MTSSIVNVEDERSPLAEQAFQLIETAFNPPDRQPTSQIAMELAEKRLGLLAGTEFHLLAGVDRSGTVQGVSSGIYLPGVNTGFISYLAVRRPARGERLGRRLRVALIDAFEDAARAQHRPPLAAAVGEVRIGSPWLARLYRDRAILPLDLNYHHPGVAPIEGKTSGWILYRQPLADDRETLPASEIRQLLYAIWRRAHRVRWPLSEEGFMVMLRDLEDREAIGAHPEVSG